LDSRRILLAIALMSLAAAVACGSGGGGSIVLPNPSGVTYSNASLKGSYVYQVHGFDTTGFPYREVGVFTADGNGNVTGGSDDSSGSTTGTTVSGNYSIATDGTGFINLNTSLGQISWAITLSSTSKFSLIEADSFANAGGTADLQVPSAIAATLNGTYVFHLHQEISAQNQAPAAAVGNLDVSSGTGSMDENLAGVFSSPNITATLAASAGLGRGTGTLVNSTTNFTTNFVYYIVDISKFVMLVSNVNAVGSGSAELQSGAVGNGLSGSYAFGSRGDDLTLNGFLAGVATVGEFTANAGAISGTEDSSVEGNISSNTSVSSCYTASANGRVVVTSASGNTCSATVTQVFWMVSPSRAFFLNDSASSVEDGTADLQTSQTFSTSTFTQQYAIVMDGVDLSQNIVPGPELYSRIGVLQFDGKGNLKLNEVVNASGTGAGVNSPGILGGTYSVGSNSRITGTLGNGTLNLVMYAVSPSQAYVLQADPGFITSGTLQLQQ
jgi:hypothetical protein